MNTRAIIRAMVGASIAIAHFSPGCASAPELPSRQPVSKPATEPKPGVVTVESGELRGTPLEEVTRYLGVPYAAPPVGELRWRPPAPPLKWQGVRDASKPGYDCAQPNLGIFANFSGVEAREDCLTVNIWAPNRTAGTAPVMVWLHPGALNFGSGSWPAFDGEQLARRGVVLVAINYRLGQFGFFAHPALTKESADGLVGNYGFMDHLAALEWIQRNIAAFGGDPANVTLFGASDGANTIARLLTMPAAKGLFHKGILQSPLTLRQALPTLAEQEAVGKKFAESRGVTSDDPAALRALSMEQVLLTTSDLEGALKGEAHSLGSLPSTRPMIDGKLITADVIDVFREQKQLAIPLIVGTNVKDLYQALPTVADVLVLPFALNPEPILFAQLGPHRERIEKLYSSASPPSSVLSETIQIDRIGVMVRYLVDQMRRKGAAGYVYRFDAVASGFSGAIEHATHAAEIPYVFGTFEQVFGRKPPPSDREVSDRLQRYWVAFARSGNPNEAGLVEWPAYDLTVDQTLQITNELPVALRALEQEKIVAYLDLLGLNK